jgi:2-polyprenyl-3-methyl-5-hydroxy-6-metoxy-1,4-benzoquinol methylase
MPSFTIVKDALLRIVGSLTGRHAVLLPGEARSEESILQLSGPYRAEPPHLTISFHEPARGHLQAEILGYVGSFPTKSIWKGAARAYSGPCAFQLDLATGNVSLAGQPWGQVPMPVPGRRFCCRFALSNGNGHTRSRMTGHYTPAVDQRPVDELYFNGDDYLDHEAQSQQEHRLALDLLRRHRAEGPVLEIGCATGGLLAALQSGGYTSYGLDFSEWAVAKASARLGTGRAWVCNVDDEPMPEEVIRKAPFGAVVLWAVLEHFRDPLEVLRKLTALSRPGTSLIINTTNADGLSHHLFGPQWEGPFDWTHLSVDHVGARSLRQWLGELGWRIQWIHTEGIWNGDADPTRATVRDWWQADARFRRLLREREMGDLLRCVAVKS